MGKKTGKKTRKNRVKTKKGAQTINIHTGNKMQKNPTGKKENPKGGPKKEKTLPKKKPHHS